MTAVDFDRDGDIDVASASFFDGRIIWYENVDGKGYIWKNHTIYVGLQGHYVSHADMDGDGDDDLIAVMHAENTVAVHLARTGCDFVSNDTAVDGMAVQQECCRIGTMWNATSMTCEHCPFGEYGVGSSGADAECTACPTDVCVIEGHHVIPATCSGITGCPDVESSIAECSCPVDSVKDVETDSCKECPDGQSRPDNPEHPERTVETLGNYSVWEQQQGMCAVYREESSSNEAILIGVIVAFIVVFIIVLAAGVFFKKKGRQNDDDVWKVRSAIRLKFWGEELLD